MSKLRRKYSDDEVVEFAKYQLANHLTIRQAANELNIPKSTFHNMMRKYLAEINPGLELEIDELYKENKKRGEVEGGKIAMKMLQSRMHNNQDKEEINSEESENRKESKFFGFLRRK